MGDLHFQLVPITPETLSEWKLFAKATHILTYGRIHRDFKSIEKPIELLFGKQIDDLKANDGLSKKMYQPDRGFNDVLDGYEHSRMGMDEYIYKTFGKEHHSQWFVGCLSSKLISAPFNFQKHAKYIEMSVGVLCFPDQKFAIHHGIQRNILYKLADGVEHKNVSMYLHAMAASAVLQKHSQIEVMICTPLPVMAELFKSRFEENPAHKLYINSEQKPLYQLMSQVKEQEQLTFETIGSNLGIESFEPSSSVSVCIPLRCLSSVSSEYAHLGAADLPDPTREEESKWHTVKQLWRLATTYSSFKPPVESAPQEDVDSAQCKNNRLG